MSTPESVFPSPAPWVGHDRKPPQHYRGLRMKTDTHLHRQLEYWITNWVPATEQDGRVRVLDLGCGEGALSQRLHDLGYDVVSVDVEQAGFRAEGPTFIPADLNEQAAMAGLVECFGGQMDVLLAVEVIEHLRCPWNFLAACRKLCGPGTHLIVTTPNVGSWWSRFWFLLTGDLWGFNPESWDDPGHVHPITVTEMRGMLRENGFAPPEVFPAGNLPVLWAYNGKRLLVSLAMFPLRPLLRGQKDGWVLCYHARIAT